MPRPRSPHAQSVIRRPRNAFAYRVQCWSFSAGGYVDVSGGRFNKLDDALADVMASRGKVRVIDRRGQVVVEVRNGRKVSA